MDATSLWRPEKPFGNEPKWPNILAKAPMFSHERQLVQTLSRVSLATIDVIVSRQETFVDRASPSVNRLTDILGVKADLAHRGCYDQKC
jgi:hypothetical protein